MAWHIPWGASLECCFKGLSGIQNPYPWVLLEQFYRNQEYVLSTIMPPVKGANVMASTF